MTPTLRRARAVVAWLLLAAVVLLAGLLVLVPRILGWVPLTILTGSMDPAMPPGSQVVVERVEGEEDAERIALGDVITFLPNPGDPTLVTHRVVARTTGADGVVLTTQGDANAAVDPEPVTAEQVRGVVRYHVPYAGYVANALTGAQKSTGVVLAVVALAGYAVVQLAGAARTAASRTPEEVAA